MVPQSTDAALPAADADAADGQVATDQRSLPGILPIAGTVGWENGAELREKHRLAAGKLTVCELEHHHFLIGKSSIEYQFSSSLC